MKDFHTCKTCNAPVQSRYFCIYCGRSFKLSIHFLLWCAGLLIGFVVISSYALHTIAKIKQTHVIAATNTEVALSWTATPTLTYTPLVTSTLISTNTPSSTPSYTHLPPTHTSTPTATRTPMPTRTPRPTSTIPVYTTLFEDSFSSTASNWEIGNYDSGNVGYRNGYYIVTSEGNGNPMWGVLDRDFGRNVAIEVEATQYSCGCEKVHPYPFLTQATRR